MKPYTWTNKYCNVFEPKGNNTTRCKKSKRQESKKIIQEQLYEYYVSNMAYFADIDSFNMYYLNK